MDRYRVAPGTEVDLSSWDPRGTTEFPGGKAEGKQYLKELVAELTELQRLLWAEDRHKVLVVFQAMDTGGKDGTIRAVLGPLNPQGVRVANFKAPTSEELAHDYLWRIHAETPGSGEIAVFNRSHYEDVLVVRVLDLVPEERWERRYGQIEAFEQRLADEGTTIVKFYLHISKEEQKERLQARLDDPAKNWKFSAGDLEHRALWQDYMRSFEVALERTSTDQAPWYIVPADRKWYRNIVVAKTLVDTLRSLKMTYPAAEDGLTEIVID